MDSKDLVVIVGGILHLAGLAAVATLTGVGVIPADVGLPIIVGQVILPTGAGLALVSPGQTPVPTGGQDQSQTAGSASPVTQAGQGATLVLTPQQAAAVAASVQPGPTGPQPASQGPGGTVS